MSEMTLLYYVIAMTLAACGIHGYPTGAPAQQCNPMMPNHGGVMAQNGASSPFAITTSAVTYFDGQQITVTVGGATRQWKGLMLQARDTNGQRVGTFTVADPNLKLVSCDNLMGTAVTHTNRNLKGSLTASWSAPLTDVGSVVFIATVVEQYNTFYVNVLSEPVTYNPPPMPPTTPPTNNNVLTNTNTNVNTNVNTVNNTMGGNPPQDGAMPNDMNTYYGYGSASSLAASALLFVATLLVSFLKF